MACLEDSMDEMETCNRIVVVGLLQGTVCLDDSMDEMETCNHEASHEEKWLGRRRAKSGHQEPTRKREDPRETDANNVKTSSGRRMKLWQRIT